MPDTNPADLAPPRMARPTEPSHIHMDPNLGELWWTGSAWLPATNFVVPTAEPEHTSAPEPAAQTPVANTESSAPQDDEPLQARVERFLALRAQKAAIERKHKDELAPIKAEMDALEGGFLDTLNRQGADNLSLRGIGSVFKATETSATLSDTDAFRNYVISNAAWNLLDWKANKVAARAFTIEHKAPPPGVNLTMRVVAQVRTAPKRGGKASEDSSGE